MRLLKRLTYPAELYLLLTTFIFTEQFERNLDLSGVEEGTIRNLLTNFSLLS